MAIDKKVYNDLYAELPEEAIERTKSAETKKGYDTTGYKYQYVINRLNEVLGIDGWTMKYDIIKVVEGQFRSGQVAYDITVDVTISIDTVVRSCAGGHRSANYADALKGAITNAMKKTAAMYGVGAKAYEGCIDDDNTPSETYYSKPQKTSQSSNLSPTERVMDMDDSPKNVQTENCSKCGVEVLGKVLTYSLDKFGKPLCFTCQK